MQRKCLRQIRMNARRQNAIDNRPELAVEEKKEQRIAEETKNEPTFDFQPGLIVKIVLDEPISDAKRFKVYILVLIQLIIIKKLCE